MPPLKDRKERVKKADLNTRQGRYFLARKAGKNKSESALLAGYADPNHTGMIENSKTYKAIEKKYFKDEILALISMKEIAEETVKTIKQDEDRGAKNKATEMVLNRLEPNETPEAEDRVLVILKD